VNQSRALAALALAAALLAAPAAQASGGDVYYEQTTVTSAGGDPGGPGVLSRVWFGGQRIRLESGGAGHGTALILRLDQGRGWRVDPVEHTAERIDLEGLRAQSKTDAALAGELMGAGEADSVRASELPGKTIAGYRCRGYRLKSSSAVIDVYTTTAVPVSMESFGAFLEWTGAADAMAGLWTEMRKLPGFPLETRALVNVLGEAHETVSTVTRLRVGAHPAALFELPAGYRETDAAR
jgi:hypothetical protein